MFRPRVSLLAIAALLTLTSLASCAVAVRDHSHASSRRHAHRSHVHRGHHHRGHVRATPVRHVRHRHAGPPGAAVVVDARVVAPAPVVHVSAPAPVVHVSEPAPNACAVYTGNGCYWMENTSGNFCWVPADWANTFEQCFAMDSCDGGRGESGGGCYKWAEASHAPRVSWAR